MPTHHALDYVEFTVRDLAEAKRFYTAAFGWAFTDYGPAYAGIQGPDREVTVRAGGPVIVRLADALGRTVR